MKKQPTPRSVTLLIACASLAGSMSAAAAPAFPQAASTSAPETVQATQESKDSTVIGGIQFDHLSFDDAVSRAQRTQKLLVVFWAGDAPTKEAAFGERLFNDEGVKRWIADQAVTVRINALDRKKDARKNGLATDQLPTVDILDIARGGRLERLRGDANATHFLAAVYGTLSAERPTGDTLNEPFSWLAWANARFRDGSDPNSGADAVAGYDWCLINADRFRPGFRAKYLEFLLERIANCKKRTPNAIESLFRERRRLAATMNRGQATEADVYELTRVDFWSRKELLTRDLFLNLRGKGENQAQCRRWLFPTVVPVLGRFEQYEEILHVVGDDPVGMFQTRIDAIAPKAPQEGAEETNADATPAAEKDAADAPKEKAPVTSLDFAIADSRSDIIDDASWVYEALLSRGRGKDAKDLMTLITTTYPVNKAFGLFVERALRVEIWAAAAEIADLGMAVLDERGQRRMQRLMKRIPKDVSTPSGGASSGKSGDKE